MAGHISANGEKLSRKAAARRCGVVMGGALSAFVAAAAMATSSAAPARADFDALIDPIIQPILASFTDSLAAFDPAAAADLTSWSDSFLTSLNAFDFALPSAAEPASALASSAAETGATTDVAASLPTTAIPITMQEVTEPTVQATVNGSADQTLLVDTGSSGLVLPWQALGSSSEFAELEALGLPSGIGFSGYTGGDAPDFLYFTYNNLPIDFPGTSLDINGPVDVEVASWPTIYTSAAAYEQLFNGTALESFLNGNDVDGILGVGDYQAGDFLTGGAEAGPTESPFEAAGYDGVLVNLPGHDLVVSNTNPGNAFDTLAGAPTPTSTLTETVTNSAGQTVGSGQVSDDIDSGGVYGTIPSSIASSTLAQGDKVAVYDGNTLLYSYTVGTDDLQQTTAPIVTSGSSIDSGYLPFAEYPIYIDYANSTLSFDNLVS